MPRHPLTVAAAALVLHAALLGVYITAPRFGGDVDALVCVARSRLTLEPYRQLHVGFPTDGYDGQFYYAMAQAPWRPHDPAYIDKPSYRQLRILYPLLAWMLSFGNPHLLRWAMPVVNLLAIAGLAGLGARLAERSGRSPWWGLLLPLAVNVGVPALRNLTDPLSTFTVLLLMTAWLRRWPVSWLGVAALLATLAREQNLIVAGIVALLALLERDGRRAAVMVVAAILWAGWAAFLWHRYDDSPFPLGNFGPPLAAMVQRLRDPFHGRSGLPIHLYGVSAMALEMIACLVVIPWLRANRATLLLGGAGTLLAALGSWLIWVDPHAYLRVFPWIPLALWLAAVQSGQRWPFLLTLPLVPWPAFVVLQVWRG